MKRLIYISTVLLLLVSCSKGPVEVLYPEPDYASVKLSSLSAVISEKGGEKTLFVATNRDDWDVVCKESWLDISIDGNSLTLIADPNTGKESRLAVVDIVAGEKPDVAKARFKVLQTGSSVVNLSAGATANSYIAATSSSFKIDASVKGNGSDDGYTFYSGTYGVDIENASFADLAWESTFDGDKTRSCSIIKGSPVYSPDEKAIYFTTGEYEGNAVLTICNPEGEILWSWHIWVTDSEIGTSSGKGLQWMDRNLGALTDSQDDIANRGMLYQWGRKDPFLPGTASSQKWPDPDLNMDDTKATIEYSVQNPMNFMTIKSSYGKEWFYSGSNYCDITRWSDSAKTIYDPCPQGWRVPDGNFLKKAGFAADGYSRPDLSDGFYLPTDICPEGAWFPMAGYIYGYHGSYKTDRGHIWTTTNGDRTSPWFISMYYYSGIADWDGWFEPASAFSVRCVKEGI